ncbi:MAG: MFS transporter [Acidimicrobiales bacterium]
MRFFRTSTFSDQFQKVPFDEKTAQLPIANQKNFRHLWTAATISALGDGLRLTVLPLFAAEKTSSPLLISLVTASSLAPWPLFGLLGGAISDRVDRRSAMWRLDAGRAVLVGSFAVFTLFSLPSILMIAVLGFILGSVETIFDNAAIALVPELVDGDFLVKANSRLLSSQTLSSQFVGPALGGILFAVARFVPIATDALSFLAAAILVATLPNTKKSAVDDIATKDGRSLRSEIAEALHFLRRQPVLLACTSLAVPLFATSGVLVAVLVLYAKNLLHVGSIGYGLLFSAFALGSLFGSALAPRFLSRFRPGQVLCAAVPLTALSFVSLCITKYVGVAAASVAILGVAVGLGNVTTTTLRQTLSPDALRGRVNSAYRTVGTSFAAAGALLGGIIAEWIGIPKTLLGCAIAIAMFGVLLPRLLRAGT